MRIAFFLGSASLDDPAPVISGVTAEIIARLCSRGATVDLLVTENHAWDVADLRPRHDLYVLKMKSPLTLSLAAVLAEHGAVLINTARSCALARDKIAATAVLAGSGVPVPPSWATGRVAALAPLLTKGPLWIKPPRGSQGRDVRRIADAAGLDTEAPLTDPYGFPLPLFVQAEAPSDGRDIKAYVVGDRLWAITRPWPARTPEEKAGTPFILPPALKRAALTCGRALGLELYGVDFLMDGDRFSVVDVNAFPGYKGIADAPHYLADYLYERARNGPIRVSA